MRKRWLALAGLAVALAVFALWPRPSRVTVDNWLKASWGMSQEQVEAVLGPPGDYRTGPTVDAAEDMGKYGGGFSGDPKPSYTLHWQSDVGRVTMGFDSQRRLVLMGFEHRRRADQSLLDSLLWRTKRLIRRQPRANDE